MAVSAINPIAGTAVGSSLLGAFAAGNAYQEMLNLGYEKGQARAYSTLVGASEAGLQYLLGGIGKLGGKLSGAAVDKIISGVDNALARAAIQLGGNMLSEGMEEGLQEILTPWFKQQMATHIDEDVNWDQVAYSSLMGTLTGFFMEGGDAALGKLNQQTQYYNTGKEIKDIDGGVEALLNAADQVRSVSSAQMQNTLTSQIDKVRQRTTARNVGQLNATVQAANNQLNQAEVAESLKGKGIPSRKIGTLAEAIVARVNGQELTRTQRNLLSSALNSSAVQDVISDMQKTLTSRSDKVSQKPTARNVGQLYTTVQTANDQANASVNQEDVAKRLLEKGFYSKEAADVAEAVAARLNRQELTRTQGSILSSALSSSAVRDTISEFINHRKTTTEQPGLEQRDQKFSGNVDLAESYERQEQAGFAREHSGAVEKVTEALNTAALRSVGKNDFAQVKIDSIKDVSWNKNVGASKWGSKKLCVLFEVEQKIVNRETERAVLFGANGEVILQKDGERGRVRFTNAEISKMRGGTLTHNHPNSSCFSPEDIHTLFNAKLSEIRAVTSDGVFRLQKPIKWPAPKYNLEMIEQIYYDIDKEICSPLYGKAYSGEISFAEAEKIGQIEVIKEFAKRHGLAFEFETWEDMRRRFNGSVY